MTLSLAHLLLVDAAKVTWTAERIIHVAADTALVLALIFNGVQLGLMRVQLRNEKSTTHVSRSLEFCHRCNELEFVRYRKPVYDLLEQKPQLLRLLEVIERDPEFKAALRFVLNFYEEIGLAYNRNELDKTIIDDFYQGQVDYLYRHTSFYIEHMRSEMKHDGLWDQFSTMRDAMQDSSGHGVKHGRNLSGSKSYSKAPRSQ